MDGSVDQLFGCGSVMQAVNHCPKIIYVPPICNNYFALGWILDRTGTSIGAGIQLVDIRIRGSDSEPVLRRHL